MSRGISNRKSVPLKLIDDRYGSDLVARLIRIVMRHGKSSIARTIVYKAMEYATDNLPGGVVISGEHNDVREKQLLVLLQTIGGITPRVEVKSKRMGGANYMVPIAVDRERGVTLALRWLVGSAQDRKEGKAMYIKLGSEIIEALEGKGGAMSKKETQDRMASANRANANLGARRQNNAEQS